ncbi:MAG: hypothetical protein H6707_04010 [Deltaproteobacteria bacterium]|nr:hypothetical protein [Deltaproteobacteria bacterium]
MKLVLAVAIFTVGGNAAFGESLKRLPFRVTSKGAPFDPIFYKLNHYAKGVGQRYTVKRFSENVHATGSAHRTFWAVSQSLYHNPNLALRGKNKLETIAAGWEFNLGERADGQISLKYYQLGTGAISRQNIPAQLLAPRSSSSSSNLIKFQGAGGDATLTVIAGGSTSSEATQSHNLHVEAQQRAFAFNHLEKTFVEMPDMPLARVAPMITRAGKEIFALGGIAREGQAARDVMLFDQDTQRWLSPRAIEERYPGLSQLPIGRFGGQVRYAEDVRIDDCGNVVNDKYLIVAGGSSKFDKKNDRVTLGEPMEEVHIYDMNRKGWLETKLPNPRMHPAMDVMYSEGGPAVVIAGGGTGEPQTSAGHVPDPMVNSTNILHLRKMAWYEGKSMPEQKALMTEHKNGSPFRWRNWAGTSMAFLNHMSYGALIKFYKQEYKIDIASLKVVKDTAATCKVTLQDRQIKAVDQRLELQFLRILRSKFSSYITFNKAYIGGLGAMDQELANESLR